MSLTRPQSTTSSAAEGCSISRKQAGLTETQIALIVLGLFGLLVLGFWINKSISLIDAQATKDICKQSVYTHAAADIKKPTFDTETINCPARELVIPRKTTDVQAKRLLADAMAECWDKYHRGTLEIFDDEGIYCAICDYVTFEKRGEMIYGFSQYLVDGIVPGEQVTYAEYFQGYESERSGWLKRELNRFDPNYQEKLLALSLETDKEYIIAFVYVKGDDNIRKAGEIITASANNPATYVAAFGVLAAAGAWITASGVIATVMAIPTIIVGGKIAVGGAIVSGLTSVLATDMSSDYLSFISMREFETEALQELGCDYVPVR